MKKDIILWCVDDEVSYPMCYPSTFKTYGEALAYCEEWKINPKEIYPIARTIKEKRGK